jgi:Zn-dependent protease with chaperone function
VCLTLAAFWIIHTAATLLVALFARSVVRLSERLEPIAGARILLAVRLFPLAAGALVAAGLCVPSYLLLEPPADAEVVGWFCGVAAFLGAAIFAGPVVRSTRSIANTARFGRYCRDAGKVVQTSAGAEPLCVIHTAPCLALAGVVSSRIVISDGVLAALSPEQLDAAIRHEQAHRAAADNFKRLLVLLSPDLVPGVRGLKRIDCAWVRLTEWAADDRAVSGSYVRALALASALIRVARLGNRSRLSPLAATLLADADDLPERVERLLNTQPARLRGFPIVVSLTASATVCALAGLILDPATLPAVHRLLEALID